MNQLLRQTKQAAKKKDTRVGENGRPIIYYDEVQKSKIKYDKEGKPLEDQPDDPTGIGELYQFLALVAGGFTFFYRAKWAAWLCVLFFYSSAINFRFDAMSQQVMTSFSLVTVAVTQAYLQPNLDQIREQQAAREAAGKVGDAAEQSMAKK